MTISELYESVAQLGFETSLEDENRFYFAVNRALLQVNAIRPATRTYIINHKPLENMIKESTFLPIEKTEDLCFEAEDVKAYYFEADGSGYVEVEYFDKNSNTWKGLSRLAFTGKNSFTAYSDFIKDGTEYKGGRIRLRFTGNYLYSVKNVAMYKYIYSDSKKDIPAHEQFSRYDISVLVDDFLSLAAPPIQKDVYGYLDKGYDVENGRIILLPYEARGLYKVIYNHKPQTISHKEDPFGDKTELDIDEDLAALIPLLVASYIWIDDEPEKAQYYYNLYRENAIDVERRQRSYTPAEIQSINGW